jgi:hypothetical protein
MAVEDDVVPVREDSLDLARRVRTTGHHSGDEPPQPFHAVLDEGVMLAIESPDIPAERGLNVAFEDRLLVEGRGVGFVRFGLAI